jgi:AraC-like DNA-binding protein
MIARSDAAPTVLAFMRNPSETRFLTNALRGLATVRAMADESAVRAEILRGAAQALVIHVDDCPPTLLIAVAVETRRVRPFLPIFVYWAGQSPRGPAVKNIFRLTHTFLLHRDTDNVRDAMRIVMNPVEWQDARIAVVRLLDDLLSDSRAREFARYCVEHIDEALTVAMVAAAIGLSVRTLGRILQHGPKPEALIGSCRLLMAASLIDRLGVRIPAIAPIVHFGSPCELRMMLQRRTGLTTGELEAGHALAIVASALWPSHLDAAQSPNIDPDGRLRDGAGRLRDCG